ncbi:MAG: 2-succinyl-5-enolpyruvyl-6-hydroxy-3-cyclohexene-1-carboxylic-acid synthase [Saprospiraceae bacterium]
MMKSNKKAVRNLIEICAAKGIEYVIISPGSRNAPLNISFNEDERFKCISVPDERVAAFIALGIGQQTQKPAIITCTSGTAALNYAPAIAEAYYQQVPMMIITADRPPEWTHQGNGQTINQTNVFANYIKRSYDLPVEFSHPNDEWYANRMISEAFERTTSYGTCGPVHINMPFREPLYGKTDYYGQPLPKNAQTIVPKGELNREVLGQLKEIWDNSQKIMILAGLHPENRGLNRYLAQLVEQDKRIVVLTEVTANLYHKGFCSNIDRLIDGLELPEETEQFKPDLLITIGHSIISKKIKQFLRPSLEDNQPFHRNTWHIGMEEFHLDTMQTLTHHVLTTPEAFFEQFERTLSCQTSPKPHVTTSNSGISYQELWKNRDKATEKAHNDFLKTCEWSDLKAFELILNALPENTNLQSGNSSAVRYVLLFPYHQKYHTHNSNRGVAGIDGCTSTAIGAAMVNNRPTTLITGDISFFYDSNAFWNSNLPENLRVIVINNGGGNIFRIIPGPSTTNQLENYFETHHNLQAEHIAKLYHLNYYQANSESTLAKALKSLYEKQENGRPAILEIQTPRLENDKVLKRYFEFIKEAIENRKEIR